MFPTEQLHISKIQSGQRLDQFLAARFPDYSRSYFNKLCKQGFVQLNGKSTKSGTLLKEKDVIVLSFHKEKIELVPAEIPLDVVYEDEQIIVLNKQAGIAVHPGKGTDNDTLVNALLFHTQQLSSEGSAERPGIVHRLDKFTSGLLVVAKTDTAHRHLRRQFDTRTIHRTYHALVWGKFQEQQGTVDTFIDRSRRDPTKFAVARTGKQAITHWKVLHNFEYASLLEVRLDTGRTHQIRVHMNYLHHPVMGDADYNGRDSQIKQLPPNLQKRGKHILKILSHQALHAKKLSFIHPATEEVVSFEAPLPKEMKSVLDKISDLFLLVPDMSAINNEK